MPAPASQNTVLFGPIVLKELASPLNCGRSTLERVASAWPVLVMSGPSTVYLSNVVWAERPRVAPTTRSWVFMRQTA